jgi:hypothetical protein
MADSLLALLKTEWTALTAAPWSFALTLAAAFGAAFAVCRWAYHSLHETTKGRIDALNERLALKDQQLDDYRERLGLAPSSGSKFSKLSHRELQEHTLRFVEKLRLWFSASEAETRRNAEQQWNALTRAQDENQRRQLWEAHTSTHTSGLYKLMSEFDLKFKVDAILLRDELASRLPAPAHDPRLDHRYEHPTNTFGIQAIADDLERKAKLLR